MFWKTKKEKLVKEMRSWGKGSSYWKYVMDLLEPHITEETYIPTADPVLTQEDYENILKAEAWVGNIRIDVLTLRARVPDNVELLDEERYDELIRFIAEAGDRMRGARQMCEQLMFGGDPMYSGRRNNESNSGPGNAH